MDTFLCCQVKYPCNDSVIKIKICLKWGPFPGKSLPTPEPSSSVDFIEKNVTQQM